MVPIKAANGAILILSIPNPSAIKIMAANIVYLNIKRKDFSAYSFLCFIAKSFFACSRSRSVALCLPSSSELFSKASFLISSMCDFSKSVVMIDPRILP